MVEIWPQGVEVLTTRRVENWVQIKNICTPRNLFCGQTSTPCGPLPLGTRWGLCPNCFCCCFCLAFTSVLKRILSFALFCHCFQSQWPFLGYKPDAPPCLHTLASLLIHFVCNFGHVYLAHMTGMLWHVLSCQWEITEMSADGPNNLLHRWLLNIGVVVLHV